MPFSCFSSTSPDHNLNLQGENLTKAYTYELFGSAPEFSESENESFRVRPSNLSVLEREIYAFSLTQLLGKDAKTDVDGKAFFSGKRIKEAASFYIFPDISLGDLKWAAALWDKRSNLARNWSTLIKVKRLLGSQCFLSVDPVFFPGADQYIYSAPTSITHAFRKQVELKKLGFSPHVTSNSLTTDETDAVHLGLSISEIRKKAFPMCDGCLSEKDVSRNTPDPECKACLLKKCLWEKSLLNEASRWHENNFPLMSEIFKKNAPSFSSGLSPLILTADQWTSSLLQYGEQFSDRSIQQDIQKILTLGKSSVLPLKQSLETYAKILLNPIPPSPHDTLTTIELDGRSYYISRNLTELEYIHQKQVIQNPQHVTQGVPLELIRYEHHVYLAIPVEVSRKSYLHMTPGSAFSARKTLWKNSTNQQESSRPPTTSFKVFLGQPDSVVVKCHSSKRTRSSGKKNKGYTKTTFGKKNPHEPRSSDQRKKSPSSPSKSPSPYHPNRTSPHASDRKNFTSTLSRKSFWN